MKAYKTMLTTILNDGHSVSVFDGEEWAVKRSTSLKEIIGAVESVDEAQIRVRDANNEVIGWALILPGESYGSKEIDDCTIADHTDNEYMNKVAA
jgi:hypothetical protein